MVSDLKRSSHIKILPQDVQPLRRDSGLTPKFVKSTVHQDASWTTLEKMSARKKIQPMPDFISTILVVQDNPDFALITQWLERRGHRVEACRSSEGALAWLTKQSADLIIADFDLPIENGFDFLKRLKDQSSRIPIIMIAGNGSADWKTVTAMGAAAFLVKPIQLPALAKILTEYVPTVTED